ncbi:MAG: TonB-dependent receptor [Bacteroidales bacterium]
MMKYVSAALLWVMLSYTLTAQEKPVVYQVNGQVVEKNSGNGIPYATVALVSNDSTGEKGMLACDNTGKFTLNVKKPQSYTLTVSAVGFRQFTTSVTIESLKTELGAIALEEGIEIKEVTVTAQKPLVKIEVDKIVYSIESDPESKTNNSLEMLSKVPLITVDAEENITLNGQSNFKVLVDGKSSSMMSTNFKDVLKSLPANTIKDIEVITNPSSKYDAEGVAGIINIITSRKKLSGYNGSVSAGMDTRGGMNGSVYLAAKINKFSFSGRFYESRYKQPEREYSSNSEYFNNTDYHFSENLGLSKYNGASRGFSGEASFEIDTLNLISMSFWGYGGSYKNTSSSEMLYRNTTNEITRRYTSAINNGEEYSTLSGNIDYQRTFKKPDQSLTFSYLLDNNPSVSKNATNVNGLVNYASYHQRSENEATGREHTIQADYFDPLTKVHQFEVGMKLILRQNKSTSETFREEVKLETDNNLDYNQYILGIYAGYVLKFKKISAKTGFRLERTWNDGVSETGGISTEFTNRLFNLVPYITLSYMPKEGHTIRTSYTQRLSRPGIWYLNPYVNNMDSMHISYGNPSLESEVSHSFELGYTHFQPKLNVSASLSGSFVNNSIERISTVQPNGAMVSTYENIGKDSRFMLNLYANYRPSPKFTFYVSGNAGYSKLAANTGYAITNEGMNYRAYMGARGPLWKDATLSMNAGIYSSSIMLQGKSSSNYYTSFGLSQYLFKRKMMLSLSASDPFWRKKSYSSENGDITFLTNSKSNYYARNLRFNLTFNFGKMNLQVKKASRGIRNDDVKGSGGNQEGEAR